MTEAPEARSENTPPPSRRPMQLVGERTVPDPPLSALIAGATTTAQPKPPQGVSRETEYIARSAWKQGVMGALNVLTLLLAVRLILFVAVVGAIVLAWTIVPLLKPSDPVAVPALIMLAIYGVLVVIPMVWLSSRR